MSDFSVLARNWLQRGIALVINEFMASNSSNSGIQDPQGQYDDWIEIYNFGDIDVNIGGMYLTDDLNDPTKWQIPDGFPSQTTINAHGFLLIWADKDTQDGPLHVGFSLSKDGEQIGLFAADGSSLIDGLTFGEQTTDISYGRYPDANDSFRFFATPTAQGDNNDAYLGLVAETEFSHERGFYEDSVNVTIVCPTPEADVYYTLDGSEPIDGEAPSAGSTEYTTAVAVSTTTCVRAAAVKPGWRPADIVTHTYIFVDDVITQSPDGQAPGPDWPPPSTGPGQWIDYGMDPDVASDGQPVST
jgi:hypothetical protein